MIQIPNVDEARSLLSRLSESTRRIRLEMEDVNSPDSKIVSMAKQAIRQAIDSDKTGFVTICLVDSLDSVMPQLQKILDLAAEESKGVSSVH